jgi:hypothetical protein
MTSRRKRAGISAVVGAAIGIMIFFTVMIPMWIFMQSVQTLFMDEVTRRLQFETEKLNEKLEIRATLQPPELDTYGRRQVFLIIGNRGPIEINVPTLYVESSRIGLQRLDRQYKLAPGEYVLEPINFYVEPYETVVIRAPTLRGNNFVTPEQIGPNRLPYLLMVQLSNMSLGYRYVVKVNVATDPRTEKVYGCVSLNSQEFAEGCKGSAEQPRVASTVDDLEDLFVFNVAPGIYTVLVVRQEWAGNRWTGEANVLPSPIRVIVDSNVFVKVGGSNVLEIETPIPLRIETTQPSSMAVLRNQTDQLSTRVKIPFIVSLGNNTEPLRKVRVEFTTTGEGVSLTPSAASMTIERLSPGEAFTGYFAVNASVTGEFGGYFTYQLRITSAIGEATSTRYDAVSISSPATTGMFYLCKLYNQQVSIGGNSTRVVSIVACGAP